MNIVYGIGNELVYSLINTIRELQIILALNYI